MVSGRSRGFPGRAATLREAARAQGACVLIALALAYGLVYTAPKPDLRSYFQVDFTDTAYQQLCVNSVLKAWKSPGNWPKPGSEAVIMSVIGRDGKLVKASLTMESGSKEWDRAAMEAVKSSAFRPLPKTYAGANLQVQWHFSVVP